MTPELHYLVYGVALLLIHIVIQATLSDLSKGLGWAVGPQDEKRDQNLTAARVERALANYLQTFVGFAALAVVLKLTETGNATSALGAAIWFWARVAYIPAYAVGIPLLRPLVWFTSIGGLVLMLLQAL